MENNAALRHAEVLLWERQKNFWRSPLPHLN